MVNLLNCKYIYKSKIHLGSSFIKHPTLNIAISLPDPVSMRVFNLELPDKPLTNFELSTYARELGIPHFIGVFMSDTLPRQPHRVESWVVNLNTSSQPGSHRICYYRKKSDRIYFDSYWQITSVEIQRYLKIGIEFARGKEVMQRNTDIVQGANTPVCGNLCLFVLKSLANGDNFQTILNHM